ncbi:uncharacterized protein LOC110931800 [Helianthus annuus]|uniref:uncharacterized protein LOC110931800 n=1 Tax=Helianthus annuus TaxID=4232 RepID=UPI000B8F1A5A|nr:uncharacterized protein LOC110931800 [Helianthus annuus]
MSTKRKEVFRGIVIITYWRIWKARNERIFEDKEVNAMDIVADIKAMGRRPRHKAFWGRIRDKFFSAMGRGVYRTPDSFSGKWGALRTKVSNFNSIYNNLVNNTRRRSGASDVDIMTEAHTEYRMLHGHMFNLVTTWELLRKSPKWHLVLPFDPTRPRSKRSKSTFTTEPSGSDARTVINLNEDADEFEEPQELPRPTGRDKSKVKAKARGKSTKSDGETNCERHGLSRKGSYVIKIAI